MVRRKESSSRERNKRVKCHGETMAEVMNECWVLIEKVKTRESGVKGISVILAYNLRSLVSKLLS